MRRRIERKNILWYHLWGRKEESYKEEKNLPLVEAKNQIYLFQAMSLEVEGKNI